MTRPTLATLAEGTSPARLGATLGSNLRPQWRRGLCLHQEGGPSAP